MAANDSLREKSFRFEVDMLNNECCDISIDLDLTERVSVKPVPGAGGKVRYQTNHLAEPQPAGDYSVYEGDDLLAEWTVAAEIL